MARDCAAGYPSEMAQTFYRYHHFPAPVIQHAVWLYLRFSLSYRDVEDLLAEPGLDVSMNAQLQDDRSAHSHRGGVNAATPTVLVYISNV